MKYFNGNTYKGEWVEDRFDGLGEYTWADGRRFIGRFKRDQIEGKGIGFWPDGRVYAGEYKNDLAHGHGLVTLPNGRIFEGTFANDYPVEGQMMESDGTTFSATFDGNTHVSEWRAKSKHLIGRFEEGWRNVSSQEGDAVSLQEFAWADGRRFAGSCNGYGPVLGVLTEADSSQYLVTYPENASFARDPLPTVKIRLKTQACPPAR